MTEFLQHLLTGLSVGAVYALIALGYTMVFGVLRLINFAHGDVVMIGAFVAYYTAKWTGASLTLPVALALLAAAFVLFGALTTVGVPGSQRRAVLGLAAGLVVCGAVVVGAWDGSYRGWAVSLVYLVLAMAVCASLGFVIERFAYRPLRQQARITALITAIGVSLLLENGGQLLFGAEPRAPLWTPTVSQLCAVENEAGCALGVNPMQIVTLVAALTLMAALQFVVFRTKIGLAMRAVSHDGPTAALMGVPTDRIISFTFMLGSALAAAAGLLYSLAYPRIDPMMGLLPGLKAFVAAVLGGIGNVPGAMAGGLILGLSEEFVAGYLRSELRDAFAFALLIGILVFRPTGLFGSTAVEKV